MKFQLYLDSADISALQECLPHPIIHGVTTNPTLLKRAGLNQSQEDLQDFVSDVLALGANQIQVQVTESYASDMVTNAWNIITMFDKSDVFDNVTKSSMIIKIPATRQGFIAGKELIDSGLLVTFTAVYTPEQAHFAAMLGAAYAAPYLGRLEDSEIDGISRITTMQRLIEGSNTRLLVASVRSRASYLALLDIGVKSITIPPALFTKLVDHDATIEAERGFLADVE